MSNVPNALPAKQFPGTIPDALGTFSSSLSYFSEPAMRSITVMNQKGGVGKTTTAVNLGAGLASLGRRVLLVDLDAQSHLTMALGLTDLTEQTPSTFELLEGKARLEECRIPIPLDGEAGGGALSLVPGSMALSGADVAFSTRIGRELLLKKALADVGDADIILFDCPPNLGVLSLNALCAAQEVLAPVQAEYLALQSLAELAATMDAVREHLNPALSLCGVLLTRFSRNKTLHREVAATIREHFPGKLFESRIRENVALAEAPGFGQDIFRYRPTSSGAQDYLLLSKELLQRETDHDR